MNPLSIEGIEAPRFPDPAPASKIKESGFAENFKNALAEVNQLQHQADHAIQEVVNGNLGIHEGMMAISEADVSLRLLIQVRSKVMEAYKEISRM